MNPMLARDYDFRPVDGWMLSEKIDGIRAIWNGEDFISREGNKFSCPEWFKLFMPHICLDGELFIEGKSLGEIAGVITKKSFVDQEWENVRFCVFDAPLAPGVFSARIPVAETAVSGCPYARYVKQTPCRGADHLMNFFQQITSRGGEGIMIKNPDSHYEQKRSINMMKFKP